MKRRDFLGAGAAGVAWLGCGASSDPQPLQPDGTVAPACSATEFNDEGPFYLAGSPQRMDLVTANTPGTILAVTGSVIAAGSCEPIAGATLDFWQADTDGVYDETGFELRGVMNASDNGLWELRTIVPGNYMDGGLLRAQHIHAKVRAPGFQEVTTQLYFSGDPNNETDSLIRVSLIMPITDNPDGSKSASFEFLLEPA